MAVLLVLAIAAACAQMQSAEQGIENNPKAVLGSVGGAAVGGLLAAALGGKGGAIVAGALVGGLLGGYVGNRLDNKDKQMAAQAATAAFEQNSSGQPSVWTNPDSGNHGSVTPTHTYQLANGQYCREYRQDVWIGNEKQQTSGTACRQADGTWQIQNS
ncbi:MAG: RT0821/Lpp0805 family surface protein [bacterium]